MTLWPFRMDDQRHDRVPDLERLVERGVRLAQRQHARGSSGQIDEHLVTGDPGDGALDRLAGSKGPNGLLFPLHLGQQLGHRLGTALGVLGGVVDVVVVLRAEPHRHAALGGI